MKSIVSEKGQITIPKRIRDRLGIRAGQVLEVDEEHGRLVARKLSVADPVDAVYGILRLDRAVDDVIDDLRGPARR